MATFYTVICNNSGEVIESGLTLDEAAREVLMSNGQSFEIIYNEKERSYDLYSHKAGRNNWGEPLMFSYADTLKSARMEMFHKVIAEEWQGHPIVITDKIFALMKLQLAIDNMEATK